MNQPELIGAEDAWSQWLRNPHASERAFVRLYPITFEDPYLYGQMIDYFVDEPTAEFEEFDRKEWPWIIRLIREEGLAEGS